MLISRVIKFNAHMKKVFNSDNNMFDLWSVMMIFFLVVSLINEQEGKSLLRVIGGKDAEAAAYPYQASLRVKGYHICGGSIINDKWILTAAHCLMKYNAEEMIAVVGTNKLMSGGVAYFSEVTKFHPSYTRGNHTNDIGLIKIAGQIIFTKSIQPIGLPIKDVDETNCIATFTGWGNSQVNVINHEDLQVIQLAVIKTSLCHLIFNLVGRGHLCTFTTIGEGICYGDSGGPLVADRVQIGIASWVAPCARGYPDVHTRVYEYIGWIDSIIDRH